MSCLICDELLHHHLFIYELISCVSHIKSISPPKLSLNYQNQTRTFQSPQAPPIWQASQKSISQSSGLVSLLYLVMLVGGRKGLGSGVLWIALLKT